MAQLAPLLSVDHIGHLASVLSLVVIGHIRYVQFRLPASFQHYPRRRRQRLQPLVGGQRVALTDALEVRRRKEGGGLDAVLVHAEDLRGICGVRRVEILECLSKIDRL